MMCEDRRIVSSKILVKRTTSEVGMRVTSLVAIRLIYSIGLMMIENIVNQLEDATGPDRKLDELIFEHVHGRKRHISTFEQYDPSEKLPAYTGSIDDAMTLYEDQILLDSIIYRGQPEMSGKMWGCRLYISGKLHNRVWGRTIPLAICKAVFIAG